VILAFGRCGRGDEPHLEGPQGARQRGWLGKTIVDPLTVERWVAEAISEEGAAYVAQVMQRVQAQQGEVPRQTLLETLQHVLQSGSTMAFGGQPEQSDRPPDLVCGTSAVLHPVRPEEVEITPAEATPRRWVTTPPDRFRVCERDGAVSEADPEISDPDEQCLFMQALRQVSPWR
jgi:hypothetical protein